MPLPSVRNRRWENGYSVLNLSQAYSAVRLIRGPCHPGVVKGPEAAEFKHISKGGVPPSVKMLVVADDTTPESEPPLVR